MYRIRGKQMEWQFYVMDSIVLHSMTRMMITLTIGVMILMVAVPMPCYDYGWLRFVLLSQDTLFANVKQKYQHKTILVSVSTFWRSVLSVT
jgi:hypothetical protein